MLNLFDWNLYYRRIWNLKLNGWISVVNKPYATIFTDSNDVHHTLGHVVDAEGWNDMIIFVSCNHLYIKCTEYVGVTREKLASRQISVRFHEQAIQIS